MATELIQTKHLDIFGYLNLLDCVKGKKMRFNGSSIKATSYDNDPTNDRLNFVNIMRAPFPVADKAIENDMTKCVCIELIR